MNENKEEIEKKMSENKEAIQKSMNVIKNILLERLPKRDIEIHGNNENRENYCAKNQSPTGNIYFIF